MTWRHRVKATVERGCVRAGIPTVARRAHRRDVLILAYHNIVPDDVEPGGDSSLHLRRSGFAEQLDLLQETHELVTLATVLEADGGGGDRPRAVVTFDDAYRGAVTLGVEEVVARDIPATVFVAPAYVGGRLFWWDLLTPEGVAAPDEALRWHALEECRGRDDEVRRWAETRGYGLRRLPSAHACASEEELRHAASQRGITFGSHSWSHPNLRRLTTSDLRAELARPLAWLRERFEHVLPVIAYPYGHASPDVERMAAALGYRAGVLVQGGWMSHRSRNPFAIPRLNVPAGLSANGFRLRTAWPVRS